ncbi:MAG: uracil-DNA glycosylase, partial [Acidimicrobiia bacterium]
LKCRPPGNRDPERVEVESCRPFLEGQLRIMRPKVILALGNFASRLLLGTREGVTRLRGRVYPYPPELAALLEAGPLEEGESEGVIVPTYHPAAVLRGRGESLAQMRADLVLVKRALQLGNR